MSLVTSHSFRLLFLITPTWIPRPINRPLNMPCNPILGRVKLTSNHSVLAKRSADCFADLADGSVRVEMLAYCAFGGEHTWILICVSAAIDA